MSYPDPLRRTPHTTRRRLLATLLVFAPALCAASCSRDTIPMAATADLQDTSPLPRRNYHRLLEPTDGTVLHGAGQTDLASFLAYSNVVAPARPTVFMTYVDLRDDLPAFFDRLRSDLADPATEHVLPQIGLSLNRGQASTHYEVQTATGTDDPAIAALCTGLQSLNRPAFVRPGYEFNGSWNGYTPTGYIAAFRRISSRLHSCAPRVALVWDWSADAELDTEAGGNTAPPSSRWQPFYPGDDAVDWWALNLFSAAGIRSAATAAFLAAADRSSHPVMVAESTPKGFNTTDSTVWPDWFQPYFTLIHIHPGIQAFHYINWNWASYPQWSDWGDARMEVAPTELREHLRNELQRPLYAKEPPTPSSR